LFCRKTNHFNGFVTRVPAERTRQAIAPRIVNGAEMSVASCTLDRRWAPIATTAEAFLSIAKVAATRLPKLYERNTSSAEFPNVAAYPSSRRGGASLEGRRGD
jgi:hypothetical protein